MISNFGNGWTWKIGKKQNQDGPGDTRKSIANPNGKDVKQLACTYYVTTLDLKDLWLVFSKFGKILDAYIAHKLSKLGKRFGFIRFLGVEDAISMARNLSTTWIGNLHLFIFVALL